MSPLITRLLFVVLTVAVPIVWGIAVNWLFRRFRPPQRSVSHDDASETEPTIEYYI